MSRSDPSEPGHASETPTAGPIDRIVEPRTKDLGGFSVERLLPAIGARMVGPFIFLDHMGPAALPAGRGMDVRPHPHIGLATVTYLFEGEIVHRDNLGYTQPIRPGAINWMTAGRGIAHSERSSPERRRDGGPLHGLQLWVALPTEDEEVEPSFHHHPADTLPAGTERGVAVRVLAGSAFGLTSPVRTFSPLFYADLRLDAGASIDLPAEHAERAAMVEVTYSFFAAGTVAVAH
jgi:redox-sensitive bicupin YhaK (pirin superfamily)